MGASPWPGASLLDPAAIPAADPEAGRLLRGMAEVKLDGEEVAVVRQGDKPRKK